MALRTRPSLGGRRTLTTALAALLAGHLVAGCGAPAATIIAAAPAGATPASSATLAAAGANGMSIWSPAVVDGRLLAAFRCEPRVGGSEASIPLAWSGVPAGTVSLAIGMSHHPDASDPSAVNGYLELWAIPPAVTAIAAGGAADGPWFMGANKDGMAVSYTSPCSKGKGIHAYVIELFALGETPAALPASDSLAVTYPALTAAVNTAAVNTVPILARATLEFTDTTP